MAAVVTRGRTGALMIRRRSDTGPSTAVRAVVMARAGNCCERCGIPVVNIPADLHHRLPRRSGGTKNPAINDPHNVVLICRDCHTHVESHRTQAKVDGWVVPSWEDPETVPLIDVFGNRFLLNDDERVDL